MKRQIRFLYVKNGGFVDLGRWGSLGLGGDHIYIGFKATGGRKLEGWMVFACNPGAAAKPKRLVEGPGLKPKQDAMAGARSARKKGAA